MQVKRGVFETVSVVKYAPVLTVDAEELANMAMIVVLAMIKDEPNNMVMPKKIAMIKEFRSVMMGPVTVNLVDDWSESTRSIGLKEAKEAVDSALFALGIQ